MDSNKFVERTLVLLKPDAVLRGIVGPILKRFERVGLKIVALKMVMASRDQILQHLPIEDKEWILGMGRKSLESYVVFGLNPKEEFGTDDPEHIGRLILEWNIQYLLSGPIVATVLEGVRAISLVRKMVGDTIPARALPGTIRGDFSSNSPDYANAEKSSCKNMVHASENEPEADTEINVWFSANEIISYERADERTMFKSN